MAKLKGKGKGAEQEPNPSGRRDPAASEREGAATGIAGAAKGAASEARAPEAEMFPEHGAARAAGRFAGAGEGRESVNGSREGSVAALREDMTEERLWDAVEAFQGYQFRTVSRLGFTYRLKVGRSGRPTRELLVDRRKNSKSLSWGSVRLAFASAKEKLGHTVARPKDLGDIRGVSYIYPMLWRFGLVEAPSDAAERMGAIEACEGEGKERP